jgi:hypothetical protein
MEDWPRAATAEVISRVRAKVLMSGILLGRVRDTLRPSPPAGVAPTEGAARFRAECGGGEGRVAFFGEGWKILHPEAMLVAYRRV